MKMTIQPIKIKEDPRNEVTSEKLFHARKIKDEIYIVIMGDVDGDGIISAADASTIVSYVRRTTSLTRYQLAAGDVNFDGYVDMNDRVIIANYNSGLITEEEIWANRP